MQEVITIRLPKEEYSQLIAKSVQLDFLRSDYDFLNRKYEDMCDRYAELRKDYTEQIQSCIRLDKTCLLYTSPSPRDGLLSRMPSSA